MTTRKKQKLIAQFCGWAYDQSGQDWHSPYGQPGFTCIPDYFNDLNAVRHAETKLNKSQRSAYTSILFQLAWEKGQTKLWILAHAAAKHRAEAVGQAARLWGKRKFLSLKEYGHVRNQL